MYRFKLKEIEVGDTDTKGGKKSTVTDVNPETGAITWDIKDVADFSSTYKELEKAKDFLSKLEKTGKSKDDPAIDKLAAQIKELFNTFRTHIRKNYPEEYKRVLRLKESVNEQSEQWTQLDVININKSLRLALKTFNNLVRNLERLEGELGKHSNKPQGNLLQDMAPDSFDYMGVQNKLNKLYNAFSNAFSIDESVNEISNTLTIRDLFGDDFPFDYVYKPEGDKIIIPKEGYNDDGTLFDMKDDWKEKIIRTFLDKMPNAVAKPNMGGGITVHLRSSINEGHGLDQVDLDYLQHIADKNPDDTKLEKIVKFLTKSNILVDKTKDLSKGKEVDEGEGIGYLTPKAFDKNKKSKGAPSIYYYKLGYKPVPKIKPKGFEVKKLWEYSDFQQKRINVFDEVEEKVNSISPLLSSAKNKTAEYYNENPGSYAIVYSTDMANELLDDIIELLKQSE